MTGALALGTLVVELNTPKVLERWSPRMALATGFVAIGGAFFGLALRPSFSIMVLLGALFGLGFGLNITVSSTFVGNIGNTKRRRRALELYSAAAGIPAVIAPPLALFVLPSVGLYGLFAIGTAGSVVGLVASVRVPQVKPQATARVKMLATIQNRRVAIPFIAFFCVTLTYGGMVSLTPFVIDGHGLDSVAFFFLLFGICRAIGRIGSATLLRHVAAKHIFLPSMLCTALGLVSLAGGALAFDLAASALVGVGQGMCQTASFVVMLDGEPTGTSSVTALWNFAIDAGTGLGALVFAPLAVAVTYRSTFLAMAAVAMTGVVLFPAERRRRHSSERWANHRDTD